MGALGLLVVDEELVVLAVGGLALGVAVEVLPVRLATVAACAAPVLARRGCPFPVRVIVTATTAPTAQATIRAPTASTPPRRRRRDAGVVRPVTATRLTGADWTRTACDV